jgi:hypothetical protein
MKQKMKIGKQYFRKRKSSRKIQEGWLPGRSKG